MKQQKITVSGYHLGVNFDPESGLFRAEYTGPGGGFDCVSSTKKGLFLEAKRSLKLFKKARLKHR